MNNFNPFEDIYDNDDYLEVKEKKNLPWIEKYRPNKLDDITSHETIMKGLYIFFNNNQLPHTLFYGPPGTGKTSTIQTYAKELYGESYNFMVMEINASEDRGIDSVRNKIKQFASSECYFQNLSENKKYKFKLIILDEVDAMTEDAQSILRHVIDNYTGNTRFCLICNYIKKIDQALQSRCISFRFSPIPYDDTKKIIKKIIKKENLKLTKSGLDTIIKRSNGDLRKALNSLQSVSMIYDKINENNINKCFGFPQKKQIENTIKLFLEKDILTCYEYIYNIININGLSLSDIISELYEYLKECIIYDGIIDSYNASIIIQRLRCIEINSFNTSSDLIQISGIVSCFKLVL